MVFSTSHGMAGAAATAVAFLACTAPVVESFGVAPGATSSIGNVNSIGSSATTSSFLKGGTRGGGGGRAGESSSTSLWSAYVVKPEMARSTGSEWRKLRTRGPGFGEKVRRAKRVPDLSEKLAAGLSYLNADEAAEIQQALAMAIYAHSLNAKTGGYEAVKAGVEACLILGELQMGTDALLSAILSGVLRHSIQPSEYGRAAVTVADIEEGFGARVARSVENFEHVMRLEEMARSRMSRRAVGEDVDAETGADTGRKQGHYLRDLIISEATDWQVLTLHLAVHMQQLRSAISSGASNTAQLARDALEIHSPLAHRLGIHHLSGGLEDLAFKALYPVEYEEIRRSTQARMGVYQEVMQTANSAIYTALHQDQSFISQGDVTLQHRIKEPYSMWKKMRRQGGGVDSVYDAVALRVVIKARREPGESDETFDEKSRELCYKAMSVAKKTFPAVEGRCKDYVLFAKSNGYQSLHSTHEVAVSPAAACAAGCEDRLTHFELQVRTASMHHKAEYGHAAHWSYKSEGKDNVKWMETASDKKNWKAYRPRATGSPGRSKGRSAVPESVSSGRELVTWLHLELRQRKVFVFGPDNLIWELDKASATAENVLSRTRNAGVSFFDEADGCSDGRSAFVNGKEVPLHYTFKNGDVLDVAMAA